jgi:two-component system NtrC family sensor kinase
MAFVTGKAGAAGAPPQSHRLSAAPEASTAPAADGLGRLIVFLWALLIGAVVVPIALVGAIAWQTYGVALSEAEALVRRTTDVLHEHELKVLETQELTLDQIASAIAGRDWDEIAASPEIAALLKKLADGKAQINANWLLDATGAVRASNMSWEPGLNGSDRDYFQAQVAADVGTFIGKAYTGRTTGRPSFSLSHRRTAPDGSFDGIISISVSPDYLQDFAARVSPEINHATALFRADGELLMRERPGRMHMPADDPLALAVKEHDAGVLWRQTSFDGAEHLTGYRKIAGYPLYVSYGVDKKTALAPWRETLAFTSTMIGGGGLAFFLVTFLALKRAMRERAIVLRLEAETARRALAEKALRQAQKIEALGQLTSGVAHDFNNLLTVIVGNLRMLHDNPARPSPAKYVAMALDAAERSSALVQSLLAFARQEPLDAAVFDLNQRLRELRPLLLQALPKSIEFVLDAATAPLMVETDVSQTEAAVLNLVVNARDAMPAGGIVRVGTSPVTLKGEMNGLLGSFVALEVSDSGAGMPPETLERACEPFFTTKEAGKGTGLGLSMVHKFAIQSGGGMAISSVVGEGTRVAVYLPICRD